MINIELPNTDIHTTPVGFGCAGLMRTASAKKRRMILGEAYDAGIRHFDLARMYGLGRAEHEVGQFLPGKREHVVLATKFGIEARETTARLAAVQGLARRLIRFVPPLRRYLRKKSGSLNVSGCYDVDTARRSLEASLRALKTGYIDIFFLHEPVLDKVENTDILEFLEKSRDRGLIRAWGLAGYPDQIGPICENLPGLAQVVQVPNDVMDRQLEQFRKYNAAYITFSPFSQALGYINGYIAREKTIAVKWSDRLGIDVRDKGKMSLMLMRYCLASNPSGVVLFSSERKEHIHNAANLVGEESLARTADIFKALVKEDIPSASI